ncbi:MAG: SRPBCC domain-containing protein [Chloroflexi bacterium]|nr:SRPBCC domain-containing protein [Chloroflexota bacterium]
MDHLSAAARTATWPPAADEVDRSGAGAETDDGEVFRALADPSRRLLLDSLFDADGQTLGELTAQLPGMTRFGVMKHLRILESAGLVATRKVGREKLHYLNPVPIRLMHDRWIGKYAEAWAGALVGLKAHLEGTAISRPRQVFQVYIRTTPPRLWQAITDPEITQGYLHHTRVESSWQAGEPIVYRQVGDVVADGKVLAVDPPHRLVTTWAFRRRPDLRDDPPSRVTWEIEPLGDSCRLTLVHDDFPGETPTFRAVGSGWPLVLSSLKSLVETGEALSLTARD